MAPPVLLDDLNKRTGSKLYHFIRRRRISDPPRPWRGVALDIYKAYNVEVDGLTVQRWYEKRTNGS